MDRVQQLRVGFFASGRGWMPYWIDRLDEHSRSWRAVDVCAGCVWIGTMLTHAANARASASSSPAARLAPNIGERSRLTTPA